MKRLSNSQRQSESQIQVLCERHSYMPKFNIPNLVLKTENHCQGQEKVTEVWGIHAQKSHSRESVENKSVTKKAHMITVMAKYRSLFVAGALTVCTCGNRKAGEEKTKTRGFSDVCVRGQRLTKV